MGRLAAGPILAEVRYSSAASLFTNYDQIVRNMETRLSVGKTAKFYLYSAHDTTVMALLGAMGEGVHGMLFDARFRIARLMYTCSDSPLRFQRDF